MSQSSTFWILCFSLLSCLVSVDIAAQDSSREFDHGIGIDQIGYLPGDAKRALVEGPATQFTVIDVATSKVVFSGKAEGSKLEPNRQLMVRSLDFSPLKTPGRYEIVVDGSRHSATFSIGVDLYRDLRAAAIKMLTYQRCGVELDADLAGDFAHAACHLGPAEIFGTGATLVADGGWHDAGDYGKYVVPGAIAVAHLLLAEELWPGRSPGILAEARYELEWLLKMQDPLTGGVYHKLTSRNFPGLDVSPDYDLSTLVASPISWTATADFGAVMAQASRMYRATDSGFAQQCLNAARRAHDWTSSHGFQGFVNPPGIQTGEYGDGNGRDEVLWLAVELLRATADVKVADEVRKLATTSTMKASAFGWEDTGLFSVLGLVLAAPKSVDDSVRSRAKALWDDRVKELQRIAISAPDGGTMRPSDFHWGSNMTLLDQSMVLVAAHRLDPRVNDAAARENLHYLLGKNSFSRSFVTGFGSDPYTNPHHRPSVAAGVFYPVPGMVSGGPNRGLEDPSARDALSGAAPARSWIDDAGSYSTNEVAIYWNTPLVFVLAGID